MSAIVAMLFGLGMLVRGALSSRPTLIDGAELLLLVPPTAFGLLLSGLSLLLLLWYRRSQIQLSGRSPTRTRAGGTSRVPSPSAMASLLVGARFAALTCLILGIVVLVEQAARELGVLTLPAEGAEELPQSWWTQRPAPNSALALALLGGSLLAAGREHPWTRRLAGQGAAAALVIALAALVGHGYGARVLYGLSHVSGMAISTAVAVAVVAIGLLFLEPNRGVADIITSGSTGGRLLRRLMPAAIIIPPVLGWVLLQAKERALVDDAFGLSLLTVTLVVAFVLLLVSQAKALHAFDFERARLHDAERALRGDAEIARRAAEYARREADAANRAKSEFLATMSHEIRTPINAIVGYTQLIEIGIAGAVSAQQRDYLARIAASSEHLRGLVDDVLDLARIEAGGIHVAHEPGLTGGLIATALDLVRPQAAARRVRLVDSRPGDPGEPFVGDEHRVRQVLVNLLSNAVKFTAAGGTVTVQCGHAASPPDGAELRPGIAYTYIQVVDTGIGIPFDEQARVFEPFHQVGQSAMREQGGTGLGLAISRRLARLMQGELTLASAPGGGSTFTLWLPTATSDWSVYEESSARSAVTRADVGAGRVHGLAEVGLLLRENVEEVLRRYSARMRSDPMLPLATHLQRSELEDHQLSFLSDIAQTLVMIEEAGDAETDLLRDGSTIQRVVAELHGAMRQRRGWTEAQLAHEYEISLEEIEGLVRQRVAEGAGDVSFALEVLGRLVERARAHGVAALRRAAEGDDAHDG
ncbi:MAG: ATP-binding protein [Gemmatimonadota bacterium]